jgi:threonine dehydratase
VQPEASPALLMSLRDGRACDPYPNGPTIADGLAGNMDPETITFDLVRLYVDGLVQVGEEELRAGIRGLVADEHLVAEGAGIAGVAAVLAGRTDLNGRRAAVIVSGANIDTGLLARILSA